MVIYGKRFNPEMYLELEEVGGIEINFGGEIEKLKSLIDKTEGVCLHPEVGNFVVGNIESVGVIDNNIGGVNRVKYSPTTHVNDMLAYTLASFIGNGLVGGFPIKKNDVENTYRFLRFTPTEGASDGCASDFNIEVWRILGKLFTEVELTLKEWDIYNLKYLYGSLWILNCGNALANELAKRVALENEERSARIMDGLVEPSELTPEELKRYGIGTF